jgi:hypothetical protein
MEFTSEDPEAISIPTGTQAPAGQWIGVRQGQVVAPDTWTDDHGYLRSSGDNSYVAWRWGPAKCRKSLRPKTIVFDPATGAPWCAHCFEIRNEYFAAKEKEETDRDRLRKMFG